MSLNKCVFHILLVFAAILNASVRGKFYRECIGFENDQQYVVNQEDCAKYIFCDGKNSFEGECLGDNYFNVKEGKCDERASVDCKVGQQLSGVDRPHSSQEGYGSSGSSSSSTDGWRVDPMNAFNNNFNNDNNIVNNWNAVDGQWMSEQQAKQQQQSGSFGGGGIVSSEAVTGLAQNAIDMGNPDSSTSVAQTPLCPRRYGLHNVSYLPNTQSCAAYYICYNGIVIPMICPRHSYFNQRTSHCERENNMHCPVSCVHLRW